MGLFKQPYTFFWFLPFKYEQKGQKEESKLNYYRCCYQHHHARIMIIHEHVWLAPRP